MARPLLAHVPGGHLLRDVERLAHIRVVEVGGGSSGIGAGRIHVHFVPSSQQQLGGTERNQTRAWLSRLGLPQALGSKAGPLPAPDATSA